MMQAHLYTNSFKLKKRGKKMILISGKSCGMCKMAKNLLFKKDLKYIEYDYEERWGMKYDIQTGLAFQLGIGVKFADKFSRKFCSFRR